MCLCLRLIGRCYKEKLCNKTMIMRKVGLVNDIEWTRNEDYFDNMYVWGGKSLVGSLSVLAERTELSLPHCCYC